MNQEREAEVEKVLEKERAGSGNFGPVANRRFHRNEPEIPLVLRTTMDDPDKIWCQDPIDEVWYRATDKRWDNRAELTRWKRLGV